jgi:16S rRNA (uracil1498-N3)-methyltransferase
MFVVAGEHFGDESIVLDGDEGRHAADVRRLSVGEPIAVTDGRGRVAEGVVAEARRGRIVVAVRERLQVPAPRPRFVVVQALAKSGRDEAAIEAMTEAGVDAVVGWQAARSIAKWTDRTLGKWQSTAREAAKQSRRAWIPDVSGPVDSAQLVELLLAAARGFVLDPQADASMAGTELPERGDVVVVVGPEGGITSDEMVGFVGAGASPVRLGPHVLRSSTAGVAALSVLSTARRWR